MKRRQVLASGAALLSVAAAGCAHPSVVLTMREATAERVANEVSTAPEPESEEYEVVAAAIENGSTTHRSRHELFDDTDTVLIDGGVYEVSETRLDSNEVTVYDVRIDVNPENTTPGLGEIEYGQLPETDRERLESVFSREFESPGEGYEMGVSYGSAAEVGEDSVLVPDQQYDVIVYEGDPYRVDVESDERTEAEYRYEATEVAPDIEAFAEQVREEYLFALSGLSEAEREVVEAAIESGHYEESDAFDSVMERIRDHDGLHVADFYGTWLVEYDGTAYVTYAEW